VRPRTDKKKQMEQGKTSSGIGEDGHIYKSLSQQGGLEFKIGGKKKGNTSNSEKGGQGGSIRSACFSVDEHIYMGKKTKESVKLSKLEKPTPNKDKEKRT